jgi:hypothetical protein
MRCTRDERNAGKAASNWLWGKEHTNRKTAWLVLFQPRPKGKITVSYCDLYVAEKVDTSTSQEEKLAYEMDIYVHISIGFLRLHSSRES